MIVTVKMMMTKKKVKMEMEVIKDLIKNIFLLLPLPYFLHQQSIIMKNLVSQIAVVCPIITVKRMIIMKVTLILIIMIIMIIIIMIMRRRMMMVTMKSKERIMKQKMFYLLLLVIVLNY